MKSEIFLRWSEEDDAYIAECPSLPGCMADGATVAEALRNLDRIRQEWRETAEKLGREGQPTVL